MADHDMELVPGSGNVFRDFGKPDADVRQLKALLAAEIIKTLEERGLTMRAAKSVTGVPASDFSHICNAQLDRFTVDRLMTVLARLDRDVEVSVSVRDRIPTASALLTPALA